MDQFGRLRGGYFQHYEPVLRDGKILVHGYLGHFREGDLKERVDEPVGLVRSKKRRATRAKDRKGDALGSNA